MPDTQRLLKLAHALGALLLLAVACGEDESSATEQDAGAVLPSSNGGDAGAAPGLPPVVDSGTVDAGSSQPPLSPADASLRPMDASMTPPSDAAAARDTAVALPVGDGGPDPYADLRQVCVDTINMYRATLNLPPLARASATQEACSDEGARVDGMMNTAHYSARNRSAACRSAGLGAQNTCPNWPYGPRTGSPTIADGLKGCLKSMWAEGMPPVPVAECTRDTAGCFQKHGHWINMQSASAKVVSCGFADLGNNKFWMNQDFASR